MPVFQGCCLVEFFGFYLDISMVSSKRAKDVAKSKLFRAAMAMVDSSNVSDVASQVNERTWFYNVGNVEDVYRLLLG